MGRRMTLNSDTMGNHQRQHHSGFKYTSESLQLGLVGPTTPFYFHSLNFLGSYHIISKSFYTDFYYLDICYYQKRSCKMEV